MDRRTFLRVTLGLGLTVGLLGCKGGEKKEEAKPAEGAAAEGACKCGKAECACRECKEGKPCTCAK